MGRPGLIADTRYYNGKRCLYGHKEGRMKSNRLCVICLANRKRKWKKSNPERKKEHETSAVLKRKYGIDLKEYKRLKEKQEGLCKLCGKVETSTHKEKVRELAVDHCHKTLKIRGLLCYKCNVGLGFFNDDINLLEKAINYLTKFQDPVII